MVSSAAVSEMSCAPFGVIFLGYASRYCLTVAPVIKEASALIYESPSHCVEKVARAVVNILTFATVLLVACLLP